VLYGYLDEHVSDLLVRVTLFYAQDVKGIALLFLFSEFVVSLVPRARSERTTLRYPTIRIRIRTMDSATVLVLLDLDVGGGAPCGLFKFGFPEILTHIHVALYLADPQMERRYRWISSFLKPVGLLTHHAAGSMIVSMLLNFVITPDRYIIGLSLILLMQHWFALVKYVSYPIYVVLILFPFWFEWTVLSENQFILANHWTNGLGLGAMLIAHWMFLLATAWD
jgi:hypothetical protein